MRFWKAAVPNFSICMNIVLLVVIYLDLRNPMMGFLMGAPFLTLVALCCASSIATAVVLFASYRKQRNNQTNSEKISNNT